MNRRTAGGRSPYVLDDSRLIDFASHSVAESRQPLNQLGVRRWAAMALAHSAAIERKVDMGQTKY